MTSIDYGKIINRSVELIKRHKWLWVYGLVLAAFGGGGGGGNWGNLGNWGDKGGKLPEGLPADLPEKTSRVLGQATSVVSEWLKSVPITTWLWLALGVLLLVGFGLTVSMILQAWAKGGLIAGLDEADRGGIPTLLSTSPRGIKALKNLLIYGLVVFGAMTAAVLVFLIVVILPLELMGNSPLKTIWIFFGVLGVGLSGLVFIILLAMNGVYAERLIVLHELSPLQAWKKGLSLSKSAFWPTVAMGIINQGIGCSLGCLSMVAMLIILGIPAAIAFLPMIGSGGFNFNPFSAIFLVLLLFVFAYANILIKALLLVFNYSNWNLFFKQIYEAESLSDGEAAEHLDIRAEEPLSDEEKEVKPWR